jgi:predicted transcriptional regulator
MNVALARRCTVYLSPEVHRAIRLKAAETDRAMSDLVEEALRESLVEDADDLAAIEARRKEPTRSFESFVADLRRRGRL